METDGREDHGKGQWSLDGVAGRDLRRKNAKRWILRLIAP